MARAIPILLALLAPVMAGSAAAGTIHDPSCGAMPVVLQSSTTVYRLPHTFVRAGSDTVRLRGAALRRGVDYALDPVRGELRLLRELAPGDTLVVEACWLLDAPPTELGLM